MNVSNIERHLQIQALLMILVCAKHNAKPLMTQRLMDLAFKECMTRGEKPTTAETHTVHLDKWEHEGIHMMSEGTDWEPKRDQEKGIVEDFLEKNMSGFTFESRNNGRETD